MERVVIDLPMNILQMMHDNGCISNGVYEVIEVYNKEFRNTPEYANIIAKVKLQQRGLDELFEELEKAKDKYNEQNKEQ